MSRSMLDFVSAFCGMYILSMLSKPTRHVENLSLCVCLSQIYIYIIIFISSSSRRSRVDCVENPETPANADFFDSLCVYVSVETNTRFMFETFIKYGKLF